jgi:hypothetical protein
MGIFYVLRNCFRIILPRSRSIFLFVPVIILTACQLPDQEQPLSLKLPIIGDTTAGSFKVSRKNVPLPDGIWTVVGTQIKKDGRRGYHTAYMLVRVEGNTLHSAVEIYTNLPIKKIGEKDDDGKGWLTVRNCTRDDLHHLKVYSNTRLGKQDCWWVNHWRMNGNRKLEHWVESRKYLKDNSITAPLDMLAATYRFANKSDYLTVTYFFDPKKSGFKQNSDVFWNISTWKTSVWHPDQVQFDHKKRNILNR